MCAREEELKTASQMVRGWLDAISTTVCMGSPSLGVVAEDGSKMESTDALSLTRGSSKLLSARTISAGSPVLRDNFLAISANAGTELDVGLKTFRRYVLDDPFTADAPVKHESVRMALLLRGG